MKKFFDFDRTLFDTDALKLDVDQYLRDLYDIDEISLKKSHEFFSGIYGKTGSIFTPEKYSEVVSCLIHVDYAEVYNNLMKFYCDDLSHYAFSGTEEYLKNLKKKDNYILSFGDKKFQELKIRNSGLFDYFENVTISQKNKIDVISEYMQSSSERVVFIDDSASYFEDIKKSDFNIMTIHFICKKQECKNVFCDGHITDIAQLSEFI